jgi:hypothetical protein
MKTAVVLLADDESHADMGRLANALELVKETQEAGDEVRLVFDGAATKWIPRLESGNDQLAPLYQAVQGNVTGACEFCAKAFGVKDDVERTQVPLLSEYDGHPSIKKLIDEGFQVVTF